MAAHVAQAQGPYTVISAMDRGDDCEKIGLVVGYVVHSKSPLESNGKIYQEKDIIRPGDPLPNNNILEHCTPIIKVYEGWKRTPIETKKRKEGPLPENVCNVLAAIEQYTGLQILGFGNGPETEDAIFIRKI